MLPRSSFALDLEEPDRDETYDQVDVAKCLSMGSDAARRAGAVVLVTQGEGVQTGPGVLVVSAEGAVGVTWWLRGDHVGLASLLVVVETAGECDGINLDKRGRIRLVPLVVRAGGDPGTRADGPGVGLLATVPPPVRQPDNILLASLDAILLKNIVKFKLTNF